MVASARKSDDDACGEGKFAGGEGEVTKVGEVVGREEVIARLRRAVSEAGGVRKFADYKHINAASVSLSLNGKIEPPPAVVNALGLFKVQITVYRPVEAARGNAA